MFNKIKYKHLFSSIVLAIPIGWFFLCEKMLIPKYVMHSVIDDYIPFVKEFIIFYISWYIYLCIAVIYLAYKSKRDYYKLIIFLFAGMCITYTLYFLFPNAEDLRPTITNNDIFSLLVKYIYSIDTPTNVCPSVHVIDSIGVWFAISNCNEIKNKKLINYITFIWMLLIILSTMFVKQHSIIDVVCGIILCILLYFPIYLPHKIKEKKYKEHNEF